MSSEENIKALLELLSKEPRRSTELSAELARIIKDQPREFKNVINSSYGGSAPAFVADIITAVQREALAMPFKWYFNKHSPDLISGLILLAKFITPGIKDADIIAPLNTFKAKLAQDMDGSFDIFHKAEIFERIIFGAFSFKLESLGANARLLSLPDMVRRRRTTVFSMAALYALLAADFDIWADITDIAGKPVVRLRDGATFEPVYIDITAKGRFVGEDDCHIYAAGNGGEWNPAVIKPMSNKQIIKRLLTNLIYVYAKTDITAADILRRILKAAA